MLDPKTLACQVVLDDPAYDEVQAVAVRATRQPDGRSTVVDDAQPLAKMYCLNVVDARSARGVLVARRERPNASACWRECR